METKTDNKRNSNFNKSITLFEFFNSKLGLWILGVIFLSAIPFIIEKVSLSYAETKRKQERIDKLLPEIEQRLDLIGNLNSQVKAYLQFDLLLAYYGFERELVVNRKYYNFKPIFVEFKNNSLKNLLYELSLLQEDINRIEKTQNVIEAINTFREKYLANLSRYEKTISTSDGNEIKIYEFDTITLENFHQDIWEPILQWKKSWRSN